MPNPLQRIFQRRQQKEMSIVPPVSMMNETIADVHDPTGWMINSSIAEVLLLHSHEIKLMAMFGYALLHGYKLYPKLSANSAVSYRFISLCLACTGGGILVPIFINSVPVTLADSYPLVIIAAFLVHEYFSVIREVIGLSPIVKVSLIVLYECNRAKVISTLIMAATKAIAPSEFQDFALFGPIFCGTIAGCGGAFLPFTNGLEPIKETGLQPPMWSAFVGATFFHLFINTSLSNGIIHAKDKAQLIMVIYFVSYNVYATYFSGAGHGHGHGHAPSKVAQGKKKD